MTPIDRFERDLPVALADLADEPVPDYFIDILGQTARSRQRPAWAFPERWTLVANPVRTIAAMAVIAILLLGGFVLLRQNDASVGVPGPTTQTPPPTPAPSASAASLTPLPAALTPSSWVASADALGYTRLAIGSPVGTDGLTTFSLTTGGSPSELIGTAAMDAPDHVRVTADDAGSCHPGPDGSFGMTVSADGATLMFVADGVDPCPNRAALARTWTRSLVGDTRGGTGTIELTGRVLQVTVPEGTSWVTNHHDTVHEMYDETSGRAIRIWMDPQGFKDPCNNDAGVFPVSSAEGFVSYLAQDPSVQVEGTEAATVDGHPATHVGFTTTAKSTDGPSCADGVALEIWPNWNEPLGWTANQWVVDLGRHWIAIEIETGQTGAASTDEMRSIIDSIRFVDLPA